MFKKAGWDPIPSTPEAYADENDPIDQSVLLHALLHHVQASARVPHRGHGTGEAEAYRLQALWLSQQGIEPRHVTRITVARYPV